MKTLTIKIERRREYIESYDKLLLSPGAIPFRPPIEGIDLGRYFTLRNVPDTDAIKIILIIILLKRQWWLGPDSLV